MMVEVTFGKRSIACEDTKGEILRAIRKNCLSCAGGLRDEVRLCPAIECTLWLYRFGDAPRTVRRTQEGAELLDPANFEFGAKYDPLKTFEDIIGDKVLAANSAEGSDSREERAEVNTRIGGQ